MQLAILATSGPRYLSFYCPVLRPNGADYQQHLHAFCRLPRLLGGHGLQTAYFVVTHALGLEIRQEVDVSPWLTKMWKMQLAVCPT